MKELEFQECSICKEQSGTPPLCASCLHNRREIETANQRIRKALLLLGLISSLLEIGKEDR